MRKNAIRVLSVLVAIVLSLSVFSACGKTEDEDVVKGGQLVIAASKVSDFWCISNTTGGEQRALRIVYETLGRYDESGKMQGWLAESFTSDFNANTLTIKLNKGIKFHDGSELNAEVLKWNLDMDNMYRPSYVNSFKSCEIVDDYTVKVYFDALDLYAENVFGELMIASKKAFDDHVSGTEVDGKGNNLAAVTWCKENAVGTGAFTFDRENDYSTTEHVFRAWSEYRIEGLPYLDSIKVVNTSSMDSTTVLGGYMNGDFDMGATVNLTLAKNLAETGFVEQTEGRNYNDTIIVMLVPNSVSNIVDGVETNPLANAKVRQALAYAIDYEGIQQSLDAGMTQLPTQLAAPGTPIYDESIKGYSYNVEKCKELLREAGYSETNKLQVKFNITQMNRDLTVAIQGEWNKTGLIDAEIRMVEYAAFKAETGSGSWVGFAIGQFGAKNDTALSLQNSFGTTLQTAFGKGMQHDDEILDLAKKALASTDTETRVSYLKQANKLIADECLVIPINVKGSPFYAASYVHGLNMYGLTSNQWSPESAWKDAE